MDFQFDVTTDGRPIKIVSLIDHEPSIPAPKHRNQVVDYANIGLGAQYDFLMRQ